AGGLCGRATVAASAAYIRDPTGREDAPWDKFSRPAAAAAARYVFVQGAIRTTSSGHDTAGQRAQVTALSARRAAGTI
ncbi:hypothetical protein, partial [Mesorhizobium sp. B2-2-2]|uniref:hypothetical protein n=1 Tax=Mesorhizobium sp. B2-2-2 TaxID=2589964 RepID=UPI0015E2ACCD